MQKTLVNKYNQRIPDSKIARPELNGKMFDACGTVQVCKAFPLFITGMSNH